MRGTLALILIAGGALLAYAVASGHFPPLPSAGTAPPPIAGEAPGWSAAPVPIAGEAPGSESSTTTTSDGITTGIGTAAARAGALRSLLAGGVQGS